MPPSLTVHGLVLTDHELSLPLDHDRPDGPQLTVFAREVAREDGRDLPWLVFLQGGPGHEAPRPTGLPASPAWLGRALREHRVLMLDQRGTGRSTPYGRERQADPAAEAAYLTHFRADAIVRDAEAFRQHLGATTWSLLGQSFGGFCALHYLSAFAGSLEKVLFTGGLPPVGRPVEEVYAATYDRMRVLNERFHEQFPDDAGRLARALDACDAGEVLGPHGRPISRRLLRTVGLQLGMDGGAEALHYLLERDPRSPAFGHDAHALLPFGARNPLYTLIHESCCADGGVTGWAAERVQPEDFAGDSLLLTGEHVFGWHLEDDPALAPYAEVARILAEHPWPRLYDAARLGKAEVPCAAAIYADDPFVDRDFSEETAALLPRMRTWVTADHLHNGLRTDGDQVLDRLLQLTRPAPEAVDLPG